MRYVRFVEQKRIAKLTRQKLFVLELALAVLPPVKRMSDAKRVHMYECVCARLDLRAVGAMQSLTNSLGEFGQGKTHKSKVTHINAHLESYKWVCSCVACNDAAFTQFFMRGEITACNNFNNVVFSVGELLRKYCLLFWLVHTFLRQHICAYDTIYVAVKHLTQLLRFCHPHNHTYKRTMWHLARPCRHCALLHATSSWHSPFRVGAAWKVNQVRHIYNAIYSLCTFEQYVTVWRVRIRIWVHNDVLAHVYVMLILRHRHISIVPHILYVLVRLLSFNVSTQTSKSALKSIN